MERLMKTATALSLFSLMSAFVMNAAAAQPPVQRPGSARRASASSGDNSRAVTFHNNFTSANITGTLTLPSRETAAPVALILTGASDTGMRAANSMSAFLVQRGFATFRLSESALNGSAEDADLNALAALNYLRSRRDVRGSQAGIVAYGNGVRIAPAVASQANSGSFLVLLGGSIIPTSPSAESDRISRSEGDILSNLNNVHCPVLIVQGEFDADGTRRSNAENATALRDALKAGEHSNFTVKTAPGQNQSLTERTGSVYGEGSSSPALSVAALRMTADWLARQTSRPGGTSPDDVENNVFRAEKPLRVFGIDLGTPYHSWYDWRPDIGGQRPVFGYWYW